MSNYKTRRSRSAEEKKAEEFNDQMQDDRAQLEADIRATERLVRQSKVELDAALSGSPWNSNAILSSEDKLESYEKGLKRLKDLLASEFDTPAQV